MSNSKHFDKFRESGLCIYCGKKPIDKGFVSCQGCREQNRLYSVKHRSLLTKKDKKRKSLQSLSWAKLNPERTKEIGKKSRRKLKLEVFNHYGGAKCACCGEKEICFLTLDHPNNDGAKHRQSLTGKKAGVTIYRALKRAKWPPGLQVLCFNCNCGRQINNGICPHHVSKPLG